VVQVRPSVLPLSKRSEFALVEKAFTEEEAHAEASRCLQCSTVCDKCVEVCPNRANYTYRITPFHATLPVLSCRDGKLQVVGKEVFSLTQDRQVLHVDDFCNNCGVCTTFCVHDGDPYLDKPCLFLDEGDFEQEEENAFKIDSNRIRSRYNGSEVQLRIVGEKMEYEDEHVIITLSPELKVKGVHLKKEFDGNLSLLRIATMASVLRGVHGSLPFFA